MPSFVRVLLWCIDIMLFRELRATALFLVALHRDECLEHLSCVVILLTLLTVEQLLYWSDSISTGRAAQIEAKTKIRFGNIVPKQWTLSGFVQHTTVLTPCTKTITRLVGNKRHCIWIKCLKMCHISGAFHLPDMQNSRYALKSGWPADRIWFSSWPAENIIYQLAVLENYSWQNVHISGWLAAEFSPAGRFEEKYAAGSFR